MAQSPSQPAVDRGQLLAQVKSIVVKIGTNALSDPSGKLDGTLIAHLATQLAALHQRGIRTTLVSSGAIGAGITELKLPGRPKDLPMLQAAASVGQRILMDTFAAAFKPHGISVGQVLITRYEFENRAFYLNLRNCIDALHRTGSIPIINENDTVSVEEIRFGDNDIIAAEVTNLLCADLLVLLSVVDGLLDPAGKTIPVIGDIDDASGNVNDTKSSRGTGGMGSKLMAAGTVRTAGEPVLIANGKMPNVITRLLAGDPIGTLIVPASKRLSSRSRWIGLTAKTRGTLTVDDGCAKALRANKSLLASGITAVAGAFEKGDPVAIIDSAGNILARGLTNYCHLDVAKIQGHKTRDFPSLLHTDTYYDEVIHRDNLVLEK
jgi:glutamate 5-kinase